jgi:hypothetical protein
MKMKKFVMAVVLILALVSGVFAQVTVAGQTFYYKEVEQYHAVTGVRSKATGSIDSFITFTNNTCYRSDVKGNRKATGGDNYTYQGERNNAYIFTASVNEEYLKTTWMYIFSKDYKRADFFAMDAFNPDWENEIRFFVQLEPVTMIPLTPTNNIAPLPRPALAQYRPSRNAPSTTYTPPSTPSYPSTPSSPSTSSGGGSGINASFYLQQYQSRENAISNAYTGRYLNATTQRAKDDVLSDIRRMQRDLRQFRLDANSKGANISAGYWETNP